MKPALLVAAVVASMAMIGLRDARADGEIALSIAAVDDSNFPQVTVIFTADDRGRPVNGLTPADITVIENDAPASVLSVKSAVDATMPLALVVTIDSSGSMAGGPIERAREAAASLVNSLGPNDSAALVAFADSVQSVQSLTTSKPNVTKGLTSLQAKGNTALYDAVAESVRVAAGSGLLRRAVVLLADGEDFGNRSKLTREQSLVQAGEGGALFYVIGVGYEIDRPYLEDLAVRSGGRFFEARGAAAIPAIYASLEQILRSQFVATASATSPAAVQDRSLTVTVRSGSLTGSASRAYQSRRLAGTEATAPASLDTTALPDAQNAGLAAAEEKQGGAGTGVPVLLILLPAFLLAAAIAVWVNGSIRPRLATAAPDAEVAHPLAGHPASGLSHGTLTLITDSTISDAFAGKIFRLSKGPAVIGSAPNCEIRVPEAAGVSAEHARIWFRDSRPMLHHLASGCVTNINGESVTFASLSDGDGIAIGPYVFVYAAADDPGHR